MAIVAFIGLVILLRHYDPGRGWGEDKACMMASQTFREEVGVPQKCGDFGTTDSVASVCIVGTSSTATVSAKVLFTHRPFEAWKVLTIHKDQICRHGSVPAN